MNIRVLLVDDHTMLREALRVMLNKESTIEVIGELADGTLIDETVAQLHPDVVVMDINMPNVNGIDAMRILKRKHPGTRVVALSAYGYKQFILEMMEAGALAFVVKSAAAEELTRAIEAAYQNKMFLCAETAATMIASANYQNLTSQENPGKRLGRRERDVLRLLSQGKSSPQIASELHIASSTVDVHRRNIMEKLDLHSVAELTKYAIRNGLTDI